MSDKLTMMSKDKVQENIEKIQKLFPNAVTEVLRDGKPTLAVDFDVLKQEMSSVLIDDREERYQMTWPDKKKSILLANSPISATLRPCKEESVDFDNTQNLYIEGDNLDVLKLLQETYLGKIKMIYIDPPYNTGNDFVYNDDFAMNSDDYADVSGQYDKQGNRLFQNTESNGRFHTDWLNMIYPRLKVAKDLLSDNGSIFISIDDNEVENLRKICDEIFGENSFIAQFNWMKTATPPSLSKNLRKKFEYILCYAKKELSKGLNGGVVEGGDMPLLNEINSIGTLRFNKDTVNFKITDGVYKAGSYDRVHLDEDIEIKKGKALNDLVLTGHFKWTQSTLTEEIKNGTEFWVKTEKFAIRYARKGERIKLPSNVISKDECGVGTNEDAQKDILALFGKKIMDYPKPISLLKYLTNMITENNDIVLDFFSGSATTAHAVMQLNAEDGGSRKFIMVQLPEKCDEKSEAYKAGYKTICDIGKERIRRAGKKINNEHDCRDLYINRIVSSVKLPTLENSLWNYLHDVEERWAVDENAAEVQEEFVRNRIIEIINDETSSDANCSLYEQYENQIEGVVNKLTQLVTGVAYCVDAGFRVLKLDSSNMKDVYYKSSDYAQDLLSSLESNIKEDRTPLDLLFQVMLELGKPLSAKIEENEIAGKKIFVVDDNDLIACFDENVTEDVVKSIAQKRPLYAVFRDNSFSSDAVAANFEQIFATYSPNTTRKVL